ncbi:MAG: hypothetical protein ACKVJE_22210 [Pseudomonadales bacterium]
MDTTHNNSLDTALLPFVPVMGRKRFAELVGVSERVVAGWISRGYIPTVNLSNGDTESRVSLINMLALSEQMKRHH